jgi:hypothetical protein
MDPVVLSAGEPGFDSTNNILKIGDGSTSFANLEQLGFDSNGRFGIGTASPSKLLDVDGVAKAKSFVSDYSVVSDASTVTFDLDSSNHFEVVLGANRTLALSNSGTAGQKFTVKLKQDGTGSRTVTWFSTINWPGGLVPTLSTTADKADTFGFICTSTNSFDGFVIGYNL